ncbi:MAG: 4-hydroxybenzoate polyprenyltransferase [Salibacteraceae bacterium]
MSPLFNRRQRYAIFKSWYLLRLVRWYSVLSIMIAQYLSALFLLNPEEDKLQLLLDPELHISIFATAFIIASGFIINSFYDLERDTINRPDHVIFSRMVSQTTCLNMYFFFNTVGVVMSFYVGKSVMLFNFLFSIALWFYSHKLKKKAFLGELSAALLNITPFFVVVIFYRTFPFDIFLYLSFIGLIIIIREIIKDVLSEKGDLIFGYETLPIKVGMRATKQTIALFMLMTIIPFSVLFKLHGFTMVMGYFFLGEVVIVVSLFLLKNASTTSQFERLNMIYKLLTIAGVLSIPLV